MNIFLIGFMGSGKSTAGKRLASRMEYEFSDVDEMIRKGENETIEEIFQQKGEHYFRQLETQYLRKLPYGKENNVIATGGGLPCHDANMEYMNKKGMTIYLKMTPGQLFHRLKHAKKERPLLKNKADEEVVEYIKVQLNQRELFYNKAHIIYNGFNLKINELMVEIEQAMRWF
jgi:shikimate kinase